MSEKAKKIADKKNAPALVRSERLVEELIESKRRRAPGTYADIRYYCRTYIVPYLNAYCPYASDFSQAHWDGDNRRVVSFLTWFDDAFPGYSPFNVKKYFGMVHKKFLSEGVLKKPVNLHIDKKRASPGRRLCADELRALVSATSCLRKPFAEQMRVILLMAIYHGMRGGEIKSLQWDRVDLGRGEIALRAEDTKTRKAREFALATPALFALKALAGVRRSNYVFPNRDAPERPMTSFKTAWRKVRDASGVECRFHDIRHTWISDALLVHKMDPLKVAVYAGVSLHVIETVYLHPRAEDTKEIVRAMEKQLIGLVS
jgi:integrase